MAMALLQMKNIRFAQDDSQTLYTLRCEEGIVVEVQLQNEHIVGRVDEDIVDGDGGLLIPSLCHSHIHLDKCYILDRGDPLISGDFAEALRVTSRVKATFKTQVEDLYERGDRLIQASLEAGVTCMRAHVEVDTTVGDTCVRTGIKLKNKWAGICDIQLSLFMQDPIFDRQEDKGPGLNAAIACEALTKHSQSIGCVASAPYVESTREQQRANIRYFLELSMRYDKHVDFHLDYDLSPVPDDTNSESAPLIYYLLAQLHELHWTERMPGRLVTIGHATRLSCFSPAQLSDLCRRIGSLPVHFIGLPQSDVYMMGRDSGERGTLNVCRQGREHGLRVSMSVNNVANAFTPQGSADPLMLCPLGVAVYQDGTLDGCKRLLMAVSSASKCAIGLSETRSDFSLVPTIGSSADFVILHNNHSFQSAALDPCYDRTTVKSGRVVSWRRSSKWLAR